MARIDYARKRRMLVYAVVLLIGVCCIILSACNKDAGIYDVSDKNATLEVNHFIAKFINKLYEGIGNIGWTVVAFTVILKLILSPLDIWQKLITRKNAKIMERMKPQLEVLQAKYGDDKQKFQQEQMALYKREKYSTFGACLPTIVTLVVFFVIFAGFREMVGWKYACDYQDCYQVYDSAMTAELGEDWENYTLDATVYANAKDKAQTAVYNFYYAEDQVESRSFLWIKNVFVPDGWQKAVPDYLTVTGQQGMATSRISGVQADEYEAVMGKVLGTGGWGKEGKWNGFLILPILSLALSVVSQKLMTAAQGMGDKKEKKTFKQRIEKLKNLGKPADQAAVANQDKKQTDQQQASMKMMQYMMPLITAVFAFMYSSAFALYMLVSSLTSTIFQLAFNLIFKIVDKQQAQKPAKAK